MVFDILQLTTKNDYRFEWWSWARDRFNINDYELTYHDEIEDADTIEGTLEKIFTKFNINRPEDFRSHSLSVSDVIRVCSSETSEDDKYYYCDSMGWVDITKNCKGAL